MNLLSHHWCLAFLFVCFALLLPLADRRYFAVPLPETTRAMLLGFVVLLVSVWVPVLAGAVWGPAAVGHRERATALSSPDGNLPSRRDVATVVDAAELRAVTCGVFFFLSVPLGFFLPLYVEPTEDLFDVLIACACLNGESGRVACSTRRLFVTLYVLRMLLATSTKRERVKCFPVSHFPVACLCSRIQ
jgi:hypothetical protein